jgi:hypothetical protein
MIPAAETSDEPVAHIDLLPTIAALTGANVPDDRVIDGEDISPLMFAQPGASTPHSALYFYGESYDPDDDQSQALEAMRSGKWKLHISTNGTQVVGTELYDLTSDIGETTNLLGSHPGVAQSLVDMAQVFNDQLRENTRPYGEATLPGAGLTGSLVTSPPNAELTSVGTADWAHWGLSSESSVNRKSGVVTQIGTLVPLGSGPFRFQAPVGVRVSYIWSDGTPTGSANTTAGVYFPGVGSGFELSVPAGSSPRTLKLYLGGWQAQAELEVRLSDGSAPEYEVTMQNLDGVFDREVTLVYHAASEGQTLQVSYTMIGGTGNVTLSATALQLDTDGDGLTDAFEVSAGTNPDLPDSDGDGLADGRGGLVPARDIPGGVDADMDGFADGEQDFGTSPVNRDTDGDGFGDGEEVAAGVDPLDDTSFPIISDGDLSGDGKLDAADILIGFQIVIGQKELTPVLISHCDVAPLVGGISAPNGQCNLGDLVVIQRMVIGL